jgi:hypothetical protein
MHLTRRRREREYLLKELPDVEKLRVFFPASIPESEARSAFDDWCGRTIRKHRKWLIADAASLPIALLLSVIPGPNLLLIYLAWRATAHYRSQRGASQASNLVIEFVREKALGELHRLVRNWPRFRARRRIRELGNSMGLSELDRAYGYGF